MSPATHSRRTNKHRLPDLPRTSVFLPPAQQLSQYIKNHHQWSVFLGLLSAHKSQRYHVQTLPAQLLSQNFHSFFYYLASSLVCINSWALTCVLHCREHSPVTLQTESMTDQNAYNNTDFPWLQLMSQQSSSWVIWQRRCSVKKTFHNLGTINSPITYAVTSFLCFVYKTFNTRDRKSVV